MSKSGNFPKSAHPRATAENFLYAFSTEEVNKILKGDPKFGDDGNWKPYGGAEKH